MVHIPITNNYLLTNKVVGEHRTPLEKFIKDGEN